MDSSTDKPEVSEQRDLMIAPLLTAATAHALLAWRRALGFSGHVLRLPQTMRVSRRTVKWRRGAPISRPLLALNVLMVGVSVFSFIHIGHALFASEVPLRLGIAQRPVVPPARSETTRRQSRSSEGYDAIATRTLFHPNRAEPTSSGAG